MKSNFIAIICLLMLLANFSAQQSTSQNGVLPVTCQGAITYADNTTMAVENITISGLSKDITVYTKPLLPSDDPTRNKTKIDLRHIDTIKPAIKEEKPSLYLFNLHEYVEIIIHWKNPDKIDQHFIIERSKEVWCTDKVVTQIKKEIAFEALKELKIDSCNAQKVQQLDDAKNMRILVQELSNQVNLLPATPIRTKMQELMHQIETIMLKKFVY